MNIESFKIPNITNIYLKIPIKKLYAFRVHARIEKSARLFIIHFELTANTEFRICKKLIKLINYSVYIHAEGIL